MRAVRFVLLLLVMFMPFHAAYAQFTGSENDPASIRWDEISTKNFRVIYPRGCDSLALEYIRELEYYRPRVAASIGMVSGQFQSRPMDVILHTRNSASNGSVSWAPSRMELYTLPTWRNNLALPWHSVLSVHEGRHAAQMQAGYRRFWRPFPYILGQIAPGAVSAYPGSMLLEGDAVVAETALTASGRGRNASFLDRYMYSWDNGDYRNYAKWRFGSIYNPTPDNYSLGYAVISGARTLFDAPYFMADYFDYIGRRPYDPWPLRHALRRVSGHKFKENFAAVMGVHYKDWEENAKKRAPYDDFHRVSSEVRHKRDYSNPVAGNDGATVWVKKDIYRNSSLVSLYPSGKEKRMMSLPYSVGKLSNAGDALYWTELRRDKRWGQVYSSVIRKYDFARGRKTTLRKEGSYASVAPYAPGRVAALRFTQTGRNEVVVMDAASGEDISVFKLPSGMYPNTLAVACGTIYVGASTGEGTGVWALADDGLLKEVLRPVPVQISRMDGYDGFVTFACDRNGSGEFYRLDIGSGKLYQLTSSRYGGKDFVLNTDGSIAFSQYSGKGTAVMMVDEGDVKAREVVWEDHYHYPVADKLSAQEDTLKFSQRLRHPVELDMSVDDRISSPKPYRKFLNGFRVHSWAPLALDMDRVSDLSLDNITKIAHLGATAWLQNSNSTFDAMIQYRAKLLKGEWFNGARLNMVYKGLYPVFELDFDLNGRRAVHYFRNTVQVPGGTSVEKWDVYEKGPCVSLDFSTYVPLQWGGDVWMYGFIPRAAFHYSNDTVSGMHSLVFNLSARAYVMQSTPSAAVYPRWGAGAQLGWTDPHVFAYLYGYVPGIACGQGLRLTALGQWDTPVHSNKYVMGTPTSLMPRGLSAYNSTAYDEGARFTADYAIPFYMGDWNIGSAFMCTRGVLTPHADLSLIKGKFSSTEERPAFMLYSAGVDFELEFSSFFWIKTPVKIGVSYSYNGGNLDMLGLENPGFSVRNYAGMIFNISIPN